MDPTNTTTTGDLPVPEVPWNDILIVSKHQGQTICWTAWRRNIAAFNDPRMWESTEAWSEYFERAESGSGWGFAGDGLIAVDLDRKVVWSINDYSTPDYFTPPNTSDVHSIDRIDTKALTALLGRPDQWDNANLKLLPADGWTKVKAVLGVNASPEPLSVSLTDFLSDAASRNGTGKPITIQEAFSALTSNRGTVSWKGHSWMCVKGTYLPDGWTQHTDRGQEPCDTLVAVLKDLQAGGFPSPNSQNIRETLASALEDMDEEDGEEVEHEVEQILAAWATPVATTGARKGPAR